jgi:hypothetical protein
MATEAARLKEEETDLTLTGLLMEELSGVLALKCSLHKHIPNDDPQENLTP